MKLSLPNTNIFLGLWRSFGVQGLTTVPDKRIFINIASKPDMYSFTTTMIHELTHRHFCMSHEPMFWENHLRLQAIFFSLSSAFAVSANPASSNALSLCNEDDDSSVVEIPPFPRYSNQSGQGKRGREANTTEMEDRNKKQKV